MTDDPRFQRETIVDVDAAVVGVSSARWVHVAAERATDEEAQALMQRHRFDILPIVSGTSVREYFRTARWNDYSVIQRRPVSYQDLLPLTTPVRDVIRALAQERRAFFFLTRERRIAGLMTVANLNCRQVTVWLFSLMAELECALAAYVNRQVADDALLREDYPPGESDRASEIRTRYEADRAKGVDAQLVEYLYLSDLVNVVARRKLFGPLGYESRSKFEGLFGPIITLRNVAAHPVRSVVTSEDACLSLWQTVQKIEEALFALRAA